MSDSSYDELPYAQLPLMETHPRRLHAVAHLYGLEAAPPNESRVLELGCAVGAYIVPGARFVGIDVSARQIHDAKAFAQGCGANNLELRCASIMDVTREWGE